MMVRSLRRRETCEAREAKVEDDEDISNMRTRAQAADPLGLDLTYLATSYGIPEPDLQRLLDAPTTESVQELFSSLTAKGKEWEDVQGTKLQLEVELENTVRTSESKVKAQKAIVTKHGKDLKELRTKLDHAEGAREALASELDRLKSSTSSSTAETQALRQRIETLEASNRDALALVESKSSEKDAVAAELSEQHGKLLALRREISSLEERNQSLESATSSQKFKEQSLQQEIDLLKRNNEWHTNELQTRSQEHAKFRKERNARIASLQRELEDSTSVVDALKRADAALQQRWDDLQVKAEESFARIASLEEEAARKELDFRAELDSTKRLADLQAQNAATHKARLQEVQSQADQIQEDAAEEIGKMQAEVETERSDKEQAERKVAELEFTVERLEQRPHISRPNTPLRNGYGGVDVHSPAAMPGSARKIVGGLSFTQLYSNYTDIQQELEAEKRRTAKLSTAMDDLITEIESRSPEIVELKAEQERLEAEVLDFSRMLDAANETRDNALRESQRWEGQASATGHEGEVLRQQLRDLSTQVKILLVELQSRDQGLGELSAQERFDLERAARGDLEDSALESMTETGRLISERLVIFRNVNQLQEKNMELLRVTRQLGEQMEGEEAREKARQSAADAQEVEDLKHKLERCKSELEATATQIDSYAKERDMFRRMLQHRGQLAPDADIQAMFGQSMGPPATPVRNGSHAEPQTPRSKDVEDLNKLIREQQTFFDQYRNETSTDRKMLKEQVDALAREKSTLQAELARAQSQLTLAGERYEMLQSNFAALRNENNELQKRSQQHAESAAKQDLRTQQVAEELMEARSTSERLRNESANIRAEKELSKRIEARVAEENKGLMDERNRIQKQFADLQSLQNERELNESETRRRLLSRTETVEAELVEAKKRLEVVTDENRKGTLRREYEEGQTRTRIDDLVKSLGNVREELVAAKTTRDQLQARVDELRIDLRAAEEKVTALQPRPTPRSNQPNSNQSQVQAGDELPAEQRLAIEASELRRDVDLVRNELDAARQEVEQYKAIAQATEEELASFNETSELYKQEMDDLIASKDSQIKELEQRITNLASELETTNNELSDLRSKSDDSSRLLAEQKATFEAELAGLRDDAERHMEEKNLYQQDIKAQAEIAQQAQQSYEDELLKHAEAARSLQTVRKDFNELRTGVAGIRAEAEAHKANLEQGEESWTEQRERFERELEDVKRRREDIDQQNKILHQQMETFSSELVSLRSGRFVTADGETDGSRPEGGQDGRSSLQDVIKYLRREKEIVDVQYELSMQESKRLQQQLDYTHHQLESTRQKLADERRQSVHNETSGASAEKLMQTINELNLFRESSTTLRNEARQARDKLEEKIKEIDRLTSEIGPLKSRVGELEGDLETKNDELKLIQEDRDHWRERTQNIISKYDRVDPAELEEMKKKLEDLKSEKARLEAEQEPLRAQIEHHAADVETKLNEKTASLNATLTRFKDQAKEQNRKQNERIREQVAELATVRSDLESARAELVQSQIALSEAQASATSAGHNIAELDAVKAELQQVKAALTDATTRSGKTDDGEENQVHESETPKEVDAALQSRVAEVETHAANQARRMEELNTELSTKQMRVTELEAQVASLQQQLETSKSALQAIAAPAKEDETVEQLKLELRKAQQDLTTAQAANTNGEETTAPPPQGNAGNESVADQVAEEVAKMRAQLEQQHELAKTQVEEERDRRIEVMKNNLRRQLKEQKEKIREELRKEMIVEHEQALQKLRTEHDATIKQLQSEHKAVMEKFSEQGTTAVVKVANSDSAVKSENSIFNILDFPDEQVMQLMQTNDRVKRIVSSNIAKRTSAEIEKFNKLIAQKDAELATLKASQVNGGSKNADSGETNKRIEELTTQLEAAVSSKDAAVKKAREMAEMKAKLQLSQRDQALAKMNVVRKAAAETPQKPVSEVWEVANKAKPAVKPAAPAAAAAVTRAAPQLPMTASAVQAALTADASPVQPGSPAQATLTPEQSEQNKLRERQARFGNVPQANTIPSTFGLPSAPLASGLPPRPERNASLPFPSGNNPQASAFIPQNTGTGPPALRGTSGLPRGGGAIPPRGNAGSLLPRGGASNISIQGAAASATRGGIASGLPRGASQSRGGRGGGSARGGAAAPAVAANAGQKRSHDGSEGGGNDAKRTRGASS
nr:protein mlp1 like [Quercus suber]